MATCHDTLLAQVRVGGENMSSNPLSDHEREVYQWQIWVEDFAESGQQRLKDASVLVSRCGGLGSVVAYELAAAGVGRLVLAHAGNIRPHVGGCRCIIGITIYRESKKKENRQVMMQDNILNNSVSW